MDLEATTRRRDSVTLVELLVANEADEARRVCVESELDGPVWYPRRHGAAAPGWDASGYTGTVPAGGRLALGFASPADPVEPPATVTADPPDSETASTTPADVVAELGDPRPPRDAVTPAADLERDWSDDTEASAPPRPAGESRPRHEDGGSTTPRVPAVPDAVTAWLDRLERRGPGPDDRAALDAVADRVAALRR